MIPLFMILMVSDDTINYHADRNHPVNFPPPKNCTVPGCVTREYTAPQLKIPTIDTTYFCYVYDFQEDIPFHLFEYEPLIDNQKYVHHMQLVSMSKIDARNLPRKEFFTCDIMSRSLSLIGSWAKGGLGVSLPKDIGIPVGPGTIHEVLILQIHYDNPSLDKHQFDSSGVRLYMTPQF